MRSSFFLWPRKKRVDEERPDSPAAGQPTASNDDQPTATAAAEPKNSRIDITTVDKAVGTPEDWDRLPSEEHIEVTEASDEKALEADDAGSSSYETDEKSEPPPQAYSTDLWALPRRPIRTAQPSPELHPRDDSGTPIPLNLLLPPARMHIHPNQAFQVALDSLAPEHTHFIRTRQNLKAGKKNLRRKKWCCIFAVLVVLGVGMFVGMAMVANHYSRLKDDGMFNAWDENERAVEDVLPEEMQIYDPTFWGDKRED